MEETTITAPEEKSKLTLTELYEKLNDSQKIFVNEYLSNGNNATAAIRPLAVNNNTYGGLRNLGHQMKNTPIVKEYINAYYEELRKNHYNDIEVYIEELKTLAYTEIAQHSVKPNKDQLALKLKALDLLQKIYYGTDKRSVSITDTDGKVIKVEYV